MDLVAYISVSILILLEVFREEYCEILKFYRFFRFNPYFIGGLSGSILGSLKSEYLICFNPYFIGGLSGSRIVTSDPSIISGFNPYFIGGLSGR